MKGRKPVTWNQTDFTNRLAPPSLPSTTTPTSPDVSAGTPLHRPASAADLEVFDLDELDDYHEEPHRLRLVDPPLPAPRIIVEYEGNDRYWVSRNRDNGAATSSVLYNRSELEELVGRINTALEISK